MCTDYGSAQKLATPKRIFNARVIITDRQGGLMATFQLFSVRGDQSWTRQRMSLCFDVYRRE